MNRAQRRSKQGRKIQQDINLKRKTMVFKAEAPVLPVQFGHGHNADGSAVVLVVRRAGVAEEQLTFSVEQAESFIKGMQSSIDATLEIRRLQAEPGKPN